MAFPLKQRTKIMHRVASRQRLFSWDHFDARLHPSNNSETNNIDYDNEYDIDDSVVNSPSNNGDDLSDYRTCISMSRHNSMLFTRSSSFAFNDFDDDDGSLTHHVVVSDDENDEDYSDINLKTIMTSKTTSTLKKMTSCLGEDDVDGDQSETFMVAMTPLSQSYHDDKTKMSMENSSIFNMNQDVHFTILSFLDLNSLRAVTLSCRYFWMLLTEPNITITPAIQEDNIGGTDGVNLINIKANMYSCARNAIWWNIIKETWPFLHLGDDDDDHNSVNDKDQEKISSLHPNMVNFITYEYVMNDETFPTDTDFDQNTSNKQHYHRCHQVNYEPLLLQSSIQSPPTSIDPYFFNLPCFRTESIRVDENTIILRRFQSPTLGKLFKSYQMTIKKDKLNHGMIGSINDCSNDSVSMEVVQFAGRVGVGDRSIRANYPLPRPLESIPVFAHEQVDSSSDTASTVQSLSMNDNNIDHSFNTRGRKRSLSLATENDSIAHNIMSMRAPMKILDRLRSCNRHGGTTNAVVMKNQQSKSNNSKLAFVSPTISNIIVDENQNIAKMKRYFEIDLTPKLMAYFEVTILPRTDESRGMNGMDVGSTSGGLLRPNNVLRNLEANVEGDDDVTPRASACVAIGLSRKEFSSTLRMPGWDSYSYGYHGDDGGIFHSRGDMIRVYGPQYGVGDCVGCGVNYANGGIFFTLNGDFLGYAWCNERIISDGKVDLYPTIGVDSPNPLACNFGHERPFTFDFSRFAATQGNF